MALDVNTLSQNDKVIVGTGIAGLILAFFPGYGVSINIASVHSSKSTSVWSMGASAKLGVLCMIIAAAFVLARAAGQKLPDLPAGPAFITLAISGLGSLFLVYRILDIPSVNGTLLSSSGVHAGRKFGLFLIVIATLVQTAFAYKAFKDSGEKAPEMRKGSTS